MNKEKKRFLRCKDFTVSQQEFDLLYNEEFDMLETFPQPLASELPMYYESENYISHTDASRNLVEKIYQVVKKFTLKRKLRLINSFHTEEKELLDIGCGTGDFMLICKKNGWNVTGVEPGEKASLIAKDKLNQNSIFTEIINLPEKQFDVITLWHVLEHIPNTQFYIQRLKEKLKPNGILIIAVPNFKSYDANYYGAFWAAFDVPRHLWHFSKTAIQKLFSIQKMKIEKILPMWFDSFYVSILSEKYKKGSTNFVKAFCIGLLSNLKAITSKEASSLIYVIKNL